MRSHSSRIQSVFTMATPVNGSASYNSHRTELSNLRPSPLGQINAGGIGSAPEFEALLSEQHEDLRSLHEKAYLPGQPKSLSGIAARAFLLGIVLCGSVTITLGLLFTTSSPLWRLPSFLATLSMFHFLEFWTTARYNTRSAKVSSFLLSQNGSAYNIAHTAAMLECLVTTVLFPHRSWLPSRVSTGLVCMGLLMIILGQGVRSGAMIQAGTNFNHVVQHRKMNEHRLVTSGLYYYLRHPSYFGFFWWGLGTQLVLGNVLCFVAYAIVLWRFFYQRIKGTPLPNVMF